RAGFSTPTPLRHRSRGAAVSGRCFLKAQTVTDGNRTRQGLVRTLVVRRLTVVAPNLNIGGDMMRASRTSPKAATEMAAAVIDRFGPPSVLHLGRIPVPEPAPNEVLIALHAAGV